jgi:hypothetical protein
MVLAVFTGWLDRQERQAIAYLMEENRVRGLMTFYTVFVIDLASRRVQIVGSTPYPNDFFMRQVGRTLTATDGLLSDHRVIICDRDRKWSLDVQRLLGEAGVRVVQTPFRRSMRTPVPNDLCGRSNTSASIGSCRSGSTISDEPSRNSSITIIASGIIKASRIGSSRAGHLVGARAESVGDHGSVAC